MHLWAGVLTIFFFLPVVGLAQSCNPSPSSCPAGHVQYYEPSSDECPQGNFTCVATTRPTPPTSPPPASPPVSRPSPPPSPPTASSNQTLIDALLAQVRTLQARLAELVAAQGGSSTDSEQAVIPALTRDLSLGSRGDDVRDLQRFLISHGDLPAGNDTGYFGPLTQQAVQAFQRTQNIVSSGTSASTGFGAVGPRTRVAIISGSSRPSGASSGRASPTAASPSTGGGGSGGGGTSSPAPVRASPAVAPAASSSLTPSPVPAGPTPPPPSPQPAGCSLNGATVAHGASVTAYQSASVSFGSQCVSQTRRCTNGTLSGTYIASTCSVEDATTCSLNGASIAHGASMTAYQAASVPFGSQCVSQSRTCSNGTLTGTYTAATCVVGAASACTWNNASLPNGQAVTAYQAASVPFGQTCASQTRTCSNGTLSGSYQYANCSAQAAAQCSFNGQAVSHGQSVTAYQAASVPFGQTCASQTRTCSNGTFSGTYQHSSCSVAAGASCLWHGQTIAHGASVTAYQSATVPAGQQCVSEQRRCANTQFSGTYQYASCTPASQTTLQNGAACTTNSQCASNYCYPGPGSSKYCIAANKNCAKPGTDGILYGDEYTSGGERYRCVAGAGLLSFLTASDSYARAKGIFQTLLPQYMSRMSNQLSNNDSFILYNTQYQLMNFAIRARRENDLQNLSKLAELASTYPLQWLRNQAGAGLPTPNSWQDISGPVTWSDANRTGGNIDNLNNVVQWMYFTGHLMNSISQVPRANRTAEMNRFLDVYSRIFSFNVPEMVFNANNAMGWDFRGWQGCSSTRLSHDEITTRKRDNSLSQLPDAPCNAVLDWDLQLYGAVLEYRKAVANDPTYVNYFNDSSKDAQLIAYLGTAYDAVENHMSWTSLRDFNGASVDGYLFNKGLWSTHRDYAFAGNTQTNPPVDGQQRTVSGVGEDMGHHIRLTWVFLSMYENKSLVGRNFPRASDMRYYANQITYGVFNQDFANPKFAMFNDGSNGWFRHYLVNGADTNGGPWTGTIAMVSGGYGFYEEFSGDVAQVVDAIAPAYMVSGSGGNAARASLTSGYIRGCTYNANSNTWSACSPYPSYVGFGPNNVESLSFFSQYTRGYSVASAPQQSQLANALIALESILRTLMAKFVP